MPTAKNGFQILNLHTKKNVKLKKKTFLGGCIAIYQNFTVGVIGGYIQKLENNITHNY